jgi:hypothetical protein
MLVVVFFPLLGIELFAWLPLLNALPLYIVGLAASVVLHHAMTRASRLPVPTGREGMMVDPRTSWIGVAAGAGCRVDRTGTEVTVAGVDGMILVVEPSGEHRGAATRQARMRAS